MTSIRRPIKSSDWKARVTEKAVWTTEPKAKAGTGQGRKGAEAIMVIIRVDIQQNKKKPGWCSSCLKLP